MTNQPAASGIVRSDLSWLPLCFSVAVIGIAGIWAYHGSFRSPLFLDDFRCIGENPSIQKLWPLDAVLSPTPRTMLATRPLANLSFALNYAVGGYDVSGYHVLNFSLHLMTALLIFGVVRRTLLRSGAMSSQNAPPKHAWVPPLIVAAAWVAHPMLVSAVSYISQRTEVLMGLFYLLTLYGFIRGAEANHRGWLALSVFACALGMSAKEVMVTAPLAVLAYDRTFIAPTIRAALFQRRTYYGALAATWLPLAWLMRRGLDPTVGLSRGTGAWDYALVQCQALAHYVSGAVWPQSLSFDHGEIAAAGLAPVVRYLWAPALLVGGAIYGLVRRNPAGFWFAWVALTLAPTSSIIPITLQPIAENRTYLPLAGGLVLLVMGARKALGERWLAVVALAIPPFVALSIERNVVFRDPIAPWREAVRINPWNARAHGNLAVGLMLNQRAAAAESHLIEAIRLKPNFADFQSNYALLLLNLGRNEDSIRHGLEAVKLDPVFASARQNLAVAMAAAGRPREALPHFVAALESQPRNADLWARYGHAKHACGNNSDALQAFRNSLAIDNRQPENHAQLGLILFQEKRFTESAAAFQNAIAIKGDYFAAHYYLALALENLGHFNEARREFETTLRLKPGDTPARQGLERITSVKLPEK